ncbi:MAG: hypothetical protein P9X24_00290 [Candidatus Hatepunaea meridiana]|nr:hypothetical protein [Candidatus Hatepunaea meridiana]
MKLTLTILLIIIAGVVFFGCEDNNSSINGHSASQIMFLYANHSNYYWDNQNNQQVYTENTTVGGVIFSDPLPRFDYLKIGNNTLSGEDFYNYYLGYVAFGSINGVAEEARITSNLDTLNVELKTSLGELTGSIDLPDTITTLTLSEYDTLQTGESFTISWSGSNADFYWVMVSYDWYDENGYYWGYYLDDYVKDDSITYPDSTFSHNGVIDYISIQPMNGAFPEEGSNGNMAGDGSGFLYYMAESIYYEGEDIIVGSGMPGGMAGTIPDRGTEIEIQSRIRQQIENRITGRQ